MTLTEKVQQIADEDFVSMVAYLGDVQRAADLIETVYETS